MTNRQKILTVRHNHLDPEGKASLAFYVLTLGYNGIVFEQVEDGKETLELTIQSEIELSEEDKEILRKQIAYGLVYPKINFA